MQRGIHSCLLLCNRRYDASEGIKGLHASDLGMLLFSDAFRPISNNSQSVASNTFWVVSEYNKASYDSRSYGPVTSGMSSTTPIPSGSSPTERQVRAQLAAMRAGSFELLLFSFEDKQKAQLISTD